MGPVCLPLHSSIDMRDHCREGRNCPDFDGSYEIKQLEQPLPALPWLSLPNQAPQFYQCWGCGMGHAAPPSLQAGPSLFSFHHYLNSGGAALEQTLVTWRSCAVRLCDSEENLGGGANGGAVPVGCSGSSDSARRGTCSAFLVS